MEGYVACRPLEGCDQIRFRRLETWKEKLMGLLGTTRDARPVVLCGCSSIHTFGMRYALDVALVSREGEVLIARKSVGPGKMVSAKGAFYAFERPSMPAPWFVPKTSVEIFPLDEEKEDDDAMRGGCYV